MRAAYFAALFDFAQRSFWAAAILARPSGLIVLRFAGFAANSEGLKLVDLLGKDEAARRPGRRCAVLSVPIKRALACCSREISASI